MHRHGAVPVVCETYGTQVLGIQPDDPWEFACSFHHATAEIVELARRTGSGPEPYRVVVHRRRRLGGGFVRVETGEAGIEYEVTGQGRPVILLHGFPDSGRLWRNQLPLLGPPP